MSDNIKKAIGSTETTKTTDKAMESVSIHSIVDDINKSDAWKRGPIEATLDADMVNHPPHYKGHPKGIECIDIIEDAPFNIAAAMKYLWRVTWGSKGRKIEDCEKAIWYIQRHIENLKKGTAK
jgi:hypothetical protein